MSWYESCLKPVIEVATFMGVVAALLYQESIIKSQRKEFERQKEKDKKTELDQLFFNTLNHYLKTSEDIHVRYEENPIEFYRDYIKNIIFEGTFTSEKSHFNALEKSINQYGVDQYLQWVTPFRKPFSICYNIEFLILFLKKIDSLEIYDDPIRDLDFKKFYVDLIFSSKSKFELTVLLIWGLFPDYIEFKCLAEKYKIFDKTINSKELDSLKNKYH